jgi:hypothetical protein
MTMLNDNPYLRERGICSDPDCEQAIDGWCDECGAKLCADCLTRHDAMHYDESGMAAEDYADCWPDGEPASERSAGMASEAVIVRVSFTSDEWCSERMRGDHRHGPADYTHDWRDSLLPDAQICGACGAIRRQHNEQKSGGSDRQGA